MTRNISLAGKRVMYFAPRFFGYDNDIADEMMRRGAHVTRLLDRPFDTPLMTAVTKLAPKLVAKAALPAYCASIAQAQDPFDIIFVVNGQTLPLTLLNELQQHSRNAIFILYLWDSIKNRSSVIPSFPKYDHIFSFERFDSNEFTFHYRPLFFSSTFDETLTEPLIYDVNFIGTAHSDRAAIVHAVDALLPPEITRFWYLFLQARWVRHYYGARNPAFRRVPRELFRYEPMKKSDIAHIFQRSRTILDIEHPLQHGLTMRTLETLGTQKKLLTTNPRIVEEEFYNPQNIRVLDRGNLHVDPEFFRQPYAPPAPSVRKRYSIAGWLDEILVKSGVMAGNVKPAP